MPPDERFLASEIHFCLKMFFSDVRWKPHTICFNCKGIFFTPLKTLDVEMPLLTTAFTFEMEEAAFNSSSSITVRKKNKTKKLLL